MNGGNFKLGLFVTVAVILLVGFLLTLGALERFKPHVRAETYFSESIRTLQPGAAVRYRGVSVGSVDWVGFVTSRYREATQREGEFQHYIMVNLELDSAALVKAGVEDVHGQVKEFVQEGLRARLASQGLGGPTFVEFEFLDPTDFPPAPIAWTPEDLYIPSAPSTVVSIVDSLVSILRQIEERSLIADLATLSSNLRNVLADVEASGLVATSGSALEEFRAASAEARTLLGDPRLDEIIDDARATLDGARTLLESDGGDFQTLVRDLTQMAATLDRAGTSLDALATTVNESDLVPRMKALAEALGPAGRDLADLAKRLDRLMSGNEQQIADAIRSLRNAALELEGMLEEIKANPSRILADPPPRRTPEGRP